MPSSKVRMLSKDHLLDLDHADVVAGDVLPSLRLNDEFIDSHIYVSLVQLWYIPCR